MMTIKIKKLQKAMTLQQARLHNEESSYKLNISKIQGRLLDF